MPDPYDTLSNEQVTGDTDNAQLAPAQPDTQPDGVPLPSAQPGDTGQPAPGPEAEIMLPKSRFDEVVSKNTELEARLQQMDQQLQYMQMAGPQQAPATTSPSSADPYAGLDPDDYISVEQAKQDRESIMQSVNQVVDVATRTAVFKAQNLDYDTMVGGVNGVTGQWTPSLYLTKALTENPAEKMYLERLDQAAQAQRAYQLAKAVYDRDNPTQPAGTPNTPLNVQQNNMNTVNAAVAPMPASSAGGGGALPQGAVIQNMNDSDWNQYDQRVAAGEFDKVR